MHTRLFAHIYNSSKFMILSQSKCNYNLIQLILRKNFCQFICSAKNLYSSIFLSFRLIICQYSFYNISPLWMCYHAIQISFCCMAISNQQDMFLIISLLSVLSEDPSQHIPKPYLSKYIYTEKYKQHLSGIICHFCEIKY